MARSFPAVAKFAVAKSLTYYELGRRLSRPPPTFALTDLQFALTITVHPTRVNPAYPSSDSRRLLPRPARTAFAQTLDFESSRPVSYPNGQSSTGMEWDVSLPLPEGFPTEAAPNGSHIVLLSAEALAGASKENMPVMASRQAGWDHGMGVHGNQPGLRFVEVLCVSLRLRRV